MAVDRAGRLIDRFVELRDPRFDPPPLRGAIAEEVLGPSGRLLTPHRRLLERANGGYLHLGALHLFGACEGPPWHSLRAWNAPDGWRATYGDLTDGLIFFAEDAFGDQFAYTGRGGEVVSFEAELGRVVPAAASFTDWLEEMIERPRGVLPVDVTEAQEVDHKHLRPGSQLFAYPPLCTVESRHDVSIGHVDAIEAMCFRGQLARQLRAAPPGARVRIEIEGVDLGEGDGER